MKAALWGIIALTAPFAHATYSPGCVEGWPASVPEGQVSIEKEVYYEGFQRVILKAPATFEGKKLEVAEMKIVDPNHPETYLFRTLLGYKEQDGVLTAGFEYENGVGTPEVLLVYGGECEYEYRHRFSGS